MKLWESYTKLLLTLSNVFMYRIFQIKDLDHASSHCVDSTTNVELSEQLKVFC